MVIVITSRIMVHLKSKHNRQLYTIVIYIVYLFLSSSQGWPPHQQQQQQSTYNDYTPGGFSGVSTVYYLLYHVVYTLPSID